MNTKKFLGWAVVGVLMVGCTAWAGEPGDAPSPVVESRTREVAAPEPESPMPMASSEPAPEAVPSSACCTKTCYRPVWKTRDITCTRRVCRYRDEVRTCKYPVYRQEQRTRTVTCWKTECETRTQQVTQCVNRIDECGRCCPEMVTCEVPIQVPVRVPYEVEQAYTVCVCDWQEKEYTVKIPYYDTEEFTCTQQYCEMEPYEVEVACCAPRCNPCCNPCCVN